MENILIETIREQMRESAASLSAMAMDESLLTRIGEVATLCVSALRQGNKLLFAGNGGSAADSQHLAGELVSRFHYDRPGLPAFALTTDSSVLTSISNDYGYQRLFARQIEAVGTAGDIFFAISTSGNSPNIIEAVNTARQKKLIAVGLTGKGGGALADLCDHTLRVPSDSTPRIQEGHILMGHIICQMIEAQMFPKD